MVDVHFKRPPVVEVVFDVSFNAAALPLKTVHAGLFWQRIRREYPNVSEHPPVVTVFEIIEPPRELLRPQVELAELPPLRRTWFTDLEGLHLIQLQDDRLIFNWKRVSESDPYPSYEMVRGRFEQCLSEFRKFIQEEDIGELIFTQHQLTYVNHISRENGLDAVGPDRLFVDYQRRNSPDRALPDLDGFRWLSRYRLPDGRGRLHFEAQYAIRKSDGERIVRLDVMARAMPKEGTDAERQRWFDLAHDSITNGFVDFTVPELHNIWERTS